RARRPGLLFAFFTLGPLVAFCAVCRLWFPRYLVFITVPFLVLAGYGLVGFVERVRGRFGVATSAALLCLACVPALLLDYRLWTDPARAGLPEIDPLGYGVPEATRFLRDELAQHPDGITVVTFEGEHEEIARGLWVHLKPRPPLALHKLNVAEQGLFARVADWSARQATYVVLCRPRAGWTPADRGPLEKILAGARRLKAYPKPGGRNAVEVYRLPGRQG